MQDAHAKLAERAAKLGLDQAVIFEGERITIDIAEEGIVLENGWRITPFSHPAVSLCYKVTADLHPHSLPALLHASTTLFLTISIGWRSLDKAALYLTCWRV